MEEHKSNCTICGEELVYLNEARDMQCHYCKEVKSSNAHCLSGHFICDFCHSASASQYIFKTCLASDETDPVSLTNKIYKHPSVKMHGPEHHFLVPAALLTTYYNVTGQKKMLHKKLFDAQKRAENVLGGFCGFYGTCGAAMGAGIFFSLVTNTTPVSGKTWQQANLITANALQEIAGSGGPRCCKRDTYISIQETVKKIKEYLDVDIPMRENISCGYSFLNNECIQTNCKYFKNVTRKA